MGEKRTYTCICDWVIMLYSRKKSNNVLGKLKKKKEVREKDRIWRVT